MYAGDELLASVETVGSTTPSVRYVHADHLGSTNALTDSAGVAVQSLDYYPFGLERVNDGAADEPRAFLGERQDDESNLNYLNARYYDSARGQFVSQDPVFWEVGETQDGKAVLLTPQALNSYSYAGNNPNTNRDPSGRGYIEDIYQGSFNTWANSRPEYSSQQVQDSSYDKLPYFYRVTGDPVNTVRLNELKMQELGTLAGSGALLMAGGAAKAPANAASASLNLERLAIRPTAAIKLENVVKQTGLTSGQILNRASESSMRFIDNFNKGNINIYTPKPSSTSMIRVTLDPTGSRIISTGFESSRNYSKYVNNGRLTPLRSQQQ